MDSQQEECHRSEVRDRTETWDLREVRLVNALADSWKLGNVQGEGMEKWDLVPCLEKFDVVHC